MNKKASIITKTEDFLLWFIPVLDGFPRKHKFLIADRMLSLSLQQASTLAAAAAVHSSLQKRVSAFPPLRFRLL